jgi:hypothetical protein
VTKLKKKSSPAFEFTYLIFEFQISKYVENEKEITAAVLPNINVEIQEAGYEGHNVVRTNVQEKLIVQQDV